MAKSKHRRGGRVRPRQQSHGRTAGAVPITDEFREALEANRLAFIAKFGREPGPDDPVFFDPDESEPLGITEEKINAQMVMSMIRAKVPEVLIYAFIRTRGMILSEENRHKWSAEDLALWRKAVEEFDRDYGDGDPDGPLDDA